jgi:hypothetical protein
MATILNAMGAPEPSPEIRRRLQAIHPKLDLKFVEAAGHHWAISLSWEDNDRRRELIQNGGIDPSGDYDIIGYLPLDCTADEAPAYIARVFREFPREDVQNLIGRINHYNETPAQKASEEALAEVLDAKDPSKASGPKIQVDVVSDVSEKPAPKKRAPRKKSTAAKSKYL